MKQIGTLEQQINSIESANINRETLAAMEKASKAMQDITHGLTPEKVDETMCVLPALNRRAVVACLGNPSYADLNTGTSCENRMPSATRSGRSWLQPPSGKHTTRRSSRASWSSYNRSSWTSRCSRRALCLWRMRCTRCHHLPTQNVSHLTPQISPAREQAPHGESETVNTNDLTWQRYQARRRRSRKTTTQSWRSCGRRWPCEGQGMETNGWRHSENLFHWIGR